MTKRLTTEDCNHYFEKYKTPPHIIAHCKAVSDTAVTIGSELVKHGVSLDTELLRNAGLIHDVLRMEKNHDVAAAEMLEKDGYPYEAEVIRHHMTKHYAPVNELTESDILCLADRVVREDEYVGIDRRIDYLIYKGGYDPVKAERLEEAKIASSLWIEQLEEIMGRSLDSLFPPSLDSLLKQVEKPARYIGGELNVVRKDPHDVDVRFAFAFPDLYEIGMSYMGLQILYHIVNQQPNLALERVFAPAQDMEELMRKTGFPLFTLETKTPVRDMDVLGFTLQYEMSFTNIINMLDLAGLPLLSKDRGEEDPLVIAGGPCAFNPEPLADFMDAFLIGDGEESLPALLNLIGDGRKRGLTREAILREAVQIEGVYVPSFYEPQYGEDAILTGYHKTWAGAPDVVRKAMVHDLDRVDYPTKTLVPLIEVVHDRAVLETFRGCTRGCRFCQAGMIYRPVRERSKENLLQLAKEQIRQTGHDEMSILSLSTSDYSDFEGLATELMGYCTANNVSLSLPSLRLDNFSFRVLSEIQKYKKSGLTFAPEAGTQRLRDVINKGITEEDIYSAVEQAIELGWRQVKLYFMIGLPGETDQDLDGIAEIARNIVALHKKSGRGGRFNVNVSISNFVPKAHTPFQWVAQDSTEEFTRKHNYLTEKLKIKNVSFNYHDDAVSTCEAIFARGDRRLSQLLLAAHEAGCRFDGWSEFFDRDTWARLLEEFPVDHRIYTERERSYDEYLPWQHIDCRVSREYLMKENEKAREAATTHDCREGCTGCGVNRYTVCTQGGSHV